MLDEELKRGFYMKVMKKKRLTCNVIGRFDLSMPLSPPARGGMAPHCVVRLSSFLTPPDAGGDRGLNPA